MRKVLIILMIFVSLQACNDTSSNRVDEKQKTDTALKGYQDTIQKAKDVEKELKKAADKQKKAIDG